METLNGKKLANNLQVALKKQIKELKDATDTVPHLCAVVVGDNEASKIYVKNKANACKRVGMKTTIETLPADTTQAKLNALLNKLSRDKEVHGILLQLPLPEHLNARESISHIKPEKDVDGLTDENLGKLVAGEPGGMVACTAQGILKLLQEYNIALEGKHCVIVGRSLLVGKPLLHLLLQQNAYVTICHSKTPHLHTYTRQADVLITAVGKKDFIRKKHVKKNAVVIDVAIVRGTDRIYGDVNTKQVAKRVAYLSPVPAGVGPLTVTMLLQNTVTAFEKQTKK